MKMISRPKIFIISFFSLLSSAMPQDIFVEKSGQPVLVLIKDNFINAKFSPDGNFIAITNQNYKDMQIGYLAINKKGEHGSYAVHPWFNYALYQGDKNRMIDSLSYLK